MKYKARVSFGGKVSMGVGEVKDISDVNIAKDLLKAGYIEEIKPAEKGEKENKETAKEKTDKKPATRAKTKRG